MNQLTSPSDTHRVQRLVRVKPYVLAIALVLLAALSPAAAGARLERKVVPTFESIRLALDPSKPIYNGSVHVDLTAREATSSFEIGPRLLVTSRWNSKYRSGDRAASSAVRGTPGFVETASTFRRTTSKPFDPRIAASSSAARRASSTVPFT